MCIFLFNIVKYFYACFFFFTDLKAESFLGFLSLSRNIFPNKEYEQIFIKGIRIIYITLLRRVTEHPGYTEIMIHLLRDTMYSTIIPICSGKSKDNILAADIHHVYWLFFQRGLNLYIQDSRQIEITLSPDEHTLILRRITQLGS